MQTTDLPPKIALAFAAHGTRNTIPLPSQIGVTPGAASLYDGFPPLTMTDPTAGGIAPDGRDFNGVLNLLSALLVWYSAGGTLTFDAAFSTLIGGYPKRCVLANASTPGSFWVSTVENNTNNPDAGQLTGWTRANMPAFTPVEQGGGPGQTTAKLNIGWTGAKPRLAVGGSDVDNIALESWVSGVTTNIYNVLLAGINTEITNRDSAVTSEATNRANQDTAIVNYVNNGFPSLLTMNSNFQGASNQNGCQKIWGGIIFQWGRLFLPTGAGDTVYFPIVFPNAVLAIQATDFGNGVNVCSAEIVNGWGPNAFKAYSRDVANPTVYKPSTAYSYFAVGY